MRDIRDIKKGVNNKKNFLYLKRFIIKTMNYIYKINTDETNVIRIHNILRGFFATHKTPNAKAYAPACLQSKNIPSLIRLIYNATPTR